MVTGGEGLESQHRQKPHLEPELNLPAKFHLSKSIGRWVDMRGTNLKNEKN